MNRSLGVLWLVISVLTSALVGVTGGILSHLAGQGVPVTIISGAVAFAGAEGLLLAMLGFAATWSKGSAKR
jgi:hypothetical protein